MQTDESRAQVCAVAGRGSRPRQRRKAILVVGMSRSGTSLITHILHTLGATLPGDLIGPDRGNPLGHWEPRALVEINSQVLADLDLAWDDPRPLPECWFRTGEAHGFALRIMAQIEQDYAGSRLLLIKDPRLCRLLPLYCEALDMLDIELTVVLQVRPVAQIVRSLAERDGISPEVSALLWLRSVTEAEWHSRHCTRIWLGFAQVTADWRDSICRIAERLDVTWPNHPSDAARRIAALLRPDAHDVEWAESGAGFRSALFACAWDAIMAGVAGDEAAAQAGFDLVRAPLSSADQLFTPVITDLMRRHEARLHAIHTSTCWRLTAPLRALKQQASRLDGVR
jgi:hypothetical protein